MLGVLLWFRASGFRVLGFGLLGLEALGFQGGFHLLRALGPFTSWDSEFFLYHVSEERLLSFEAGIQVKGSEYDLQGALPCAAAVAESSY